MNNITIGLDISKDKIDACLWPKQEFHQFDNDARGHKKLIRWIGSDVKRIVFEPTGSYHRQLEQALVQAKLPAHKINPKQARHFAKAIGKLATARRGFVRDRVACKNRLHKTQKPLLKRQYKATLKQIERQIEEIDQLIISLIEQEQGMKNQLELLPSLGNQGNGADAPSSKAEDNT